jgi:hypothetical protein
MLGFTEAEKRSAPALRRARDATTLIMGLVPRLNDRQVVRVRQVLAYVMRARAFVKAVRRVAEMERQHLRMDVRLFRQYRQAALELTGLTEDTPDEVLADAVTEIT